MKFAHALLALSALMLGRPAAAATNIVLDPSFETGVNGVGSVWSHSREMGLYTTEVGYARTGSGLARANCYDLAACTGTFNQGAYFEQNLVTVAGQYYDFSVWIAESAEGPSAFSVFWGGQLLALVANPNNNSAALSAGSPGFPGYKQFFVNGLLATSALTNLQVHGGQSRLGIYFDDVSVTAAVPEPATWAMLLLGFFGIGAALRRRRPAGAALA